MKAVVVYESHWGNTAEVARAIASGLGPETPFWGPTRRSVRSLRTPISSSPVPP